VVEFATREQARAAIDELGDVMFMGRPIFLRWVSFAALRD
jgi:RNA recognition motif-containing protein